MTLPSFRWNPGPRLEGWGSIRGRAARWGVVVALGVLVPDIPAPARAADAAPVVVLRPEKADVSLPLREIPPIPPRAGKWVQPEHRVPDWVNQPPEPPKPFTGVHVLQDFPGRMLMPTPTLQFEGVGEGLPGYNANVVPPDTEGDIGPNHYVQWVNLHFAIFDRTGNILYGPAAGNTIWSGFGGPCETDNDGDPIVQYDQFADRWFISQFAVTSGYRQCIAVSVTGDPLGPWYRYAYAFTLFNDYPKFGVWVTADGTNSMYVGTYNMFNGNNFQGAQVCGYNRAKMLAGDSTAEGVCLGPYSSYASLLPADVDGPTPAPAGSPNYLLARSTNALLFWRFSVNWSANPPTATLTGPATISVAAFTPGCSPSWTCVPQPGVTQLLDSLGDRLMYRLAYRNFGTHESLVVNHAINGSSPLAIRWYELRNLQNTPPSVYQSGTYQPDTHSRWMGSAAMDGEGNLAIGYSVSSSTLYPSIRYAGRLATDPLGQLSQGEATLIAGSGSQQSYDRWGDYSSLSVDPVDDCTFWYTNEYLATTGNFNWSTRIGAFRFPATDPGPSLAAAANGNNRIDLSWTAVSGATRYLVYRATAAGGPYSLVATVYPPSTSYTDLNVQGGVTYYYKVSHNRCTVQDSNVAQVTAQGACTAPPQFAGVVAVSNPYNATCQLQVSWNPATAVCGGPVTYSVYRATTPTFTPSASNRIATNLTGTSFTDQNGLVSGTTYYYIVRATDQSNGVEDSNAVVKGGAPYGPTAQQTLLSENFDTLANGALPPGWGTGVFAGNANDWRGSQACSPAHSGTRILRCGGNGCTANYGNGNHAFTRTSGVVVPPGSHTVRLSFYHRWNFETNYDGGYLRVSLNGSTWTYVPSTAFLAGGYNNLNQWWSGNLSTSFTQSVVDLDAACNLASGGTDGCQGKTVYVAFVEYTDGSFNYPGWYIDTVTVTAQVPIACSNTPNDVSSFTATATANQVKLEWVNPASGGYGSTRICWSTTAYPTDPAACGSNVIDKAGTPGGYDAYVHTGLTNGTTYFYTAFVNNGGGIFSDGRLVSAKPFATSGPVKWGYSTGALSAAPPGVRPGAFGSGAVYAVANDRFEHAMNVTAAGGDWPRTGSYSWVPAAMNGPAQARPPVVPVTLGSVPLWVFLGSQDGTVYGIDGRTGAVVWRTAPLGEVVQAAPSGMFTLYGGGWNLLFVGTRNALSGNRMYALNPANGTTLWSFDNGGGSNGIGIISAGATVDYASNRLYFTSRGRGGGSPDTLWCLSFTNTGASKVWSVNVGDSDAAPVLYGGRLYVGTNDGAVKAVDPVSGSVIWTFSAGDGPIKGFVIPAFTALPRKLYFTTTNRVWSITDQGASATLDWSLTTIPNPSVPLLNPATGYLYVGASNGRLYQIHTGTQAVTWVTLPRGTYIGAPTLDTSNQMIYVGSDEGVVHAVSVPLP